MAGGRDQRAGGAYVEISSNRAALTKGLNAAAKELTAFGGKVRNIGAAIGGVGAAITAPLALAVNQFSKWGDGIAKMSRRTGLAVETISAMNVQAQLTGTTIESLEKAVKAMARGIFDAKRGAGEMKDALKEMNISFEDLDGLDPDKQFWILAKAIANIKDPSIRAAVAMKTFGKAGADLIPLFDSGQKSMEDVEKKAAELGFVLTTKAAPGAEVLTDQLTWLNIAFKGIQNTIGGVLSKDVAIFSEVLVEAAKRVVSLIKEKKELIRTAASVGAALVAIGGALAATGVAIQAIGFAAAGLAQGLSIVAAVFNPVVIAAAAAATGMLLFLDAIGLVKTGFSDLVQGIRVGGQSIGAWMQAAWLGVYEGWETVKDGIMLGWDSLVISAQTVGSKIYQALAGVAEDIAVAFWDSMKSVVDAVVNTAKFLAKQRAKLTGDTGQQYKDLVDIEALERKFKSFADSQKNTAKDVYGGAAEGAAAENEKRWAAFFDMREKRQKDAKKRAEDLNKTVGRIFQEDHGKEDPLAKLIEGAKSKVDGLSKTALGFSDKINTAIDQAYATARGEGKGTKGSGLADKVDSMAATKSPSQAFGSFSAREVSGRVADQSAKELNKANGFLSTIAKTNKLIADQGVGLG